ncbi:outer membrane beta-barrel protein [Campylobacter sp. FMV-PI01]|uniref:Outer membrane beta-barrel protein n=1 Tax=Campylobacter portucalensis TaxID=2608384 RepID=A0A6L5WGM7_9BACT|nr:outer membrane beta-barrel protein [Campylobacter portucalensis]MSN96338.1 outer membrane beta-barrel protein [Campylobacter portucalensis]
MKNLVKFSFVASLLVASSLNAHKGAFVGVEGIYSKTSSDISIHPEKNHLGNNQKVKFSKSTPGFGIKGGYNFGDFRAYGGYEYLFKAKNSKNGKTSKATTHNLYIGFDYTPEITNDLKAVVGAYTGTSIISDKLNNDASNGGGDGVSHSETYSISYSGTGWLIGTKLGLEYIVADHHGLEFGVKYDYAYFKNHKDKSGNYINSIKNRNLKPYLSYSFYF